MRPVPSNCALAAIAAWIADPLSTRVRIARNRCGRWHVYWETAEGAFEFYAKGRASKPYLRNLLYMGQVRTFNAIAARTVGDRQQEGADIRLQPTQGLPRGGEAGHLPSSGLGNRRSLSIGAAE